MIQQLIINGVIAGSIYALIALGFTLIYRTVRFFHFAHGAIYVAGAYLAYSLANSFGFNHIVSFFLASAIAAIVGIAIDRIVYLPLRKRKAPALVFLIASFGAFILIQNLLQLVYGAQIVSFKQPLAMQGHNVFGAFITNTQMLILVASALLCLTLWVFIRTTKLGKAMRAVSDDPMAASVVGIYPERTILLSFAIGSALAGAAGILISLETNIEPSMGLNAILKGIIASIIGGVGSIPGALMGGLVLGLAENIGIYKLPAEWKDSIAFAILLILLVIRPSGISSRTMAQERL